MQDERLFTWRAIARLGPQIYNLSTFFLNLANIYPPLLLSQSQKVTLIKTQFHIITQTSTVTNGKCNYEIPVVLPKIIFVPFQIFHLQYRAIIEQATCEHVQTLCNSCCSCQVQHVLLAHLWNHQGSLIDNSRKAELGRGEHLLLLVNQSENFNRAKAKTKHWEVLLLHLLWMIQGLLGQNGSTVI